MFSYLDLSMKPIEEEDLEKLRKLRNDPSTWKHLGSVGMISKEEQAKWFQSLRSSERYYLVETDLAVGIGLIRTDKIDLVNRSIRIGADIFPGMRGLGYGTKIYDMLLRYCFDYLNMNRVWLLVLENNTIAQHLYRKLGFRLEGTMRKAIYRDGKYLDYHIMSILKEEYSP